MKSFRSVLSFQPHNRSGKGFTPLRCLSATIRTTTRRSWFKSCDSGLGRGTAVLSTAAALSSSSLLDLFRSAVAAGNKGTNLVPETVASETEKNNNASPLRRLIRYNPQCCPRSALFIPCHKPRALRKALNELQADCFILDLEDSVGPSSKREARECLREFIETEVPRWREAKHLEWQEQVGAVASGVEASPAGMTPYPRFMVRVNSPDYDPSNAVLDLEVVGLLGSHIEGVAIPKVTPNSYDFVKDYLHPKLVLWAFFETPQSILQAHEICSSQRYKIAVMGYNDLLTELAIPNPAQYAPVDFCATVHSGKAADVPRGGLFSALLPAQRASLAATARLPRSMAAMQVLLAARAHQMALLDGVFNDPTDTEGFREDLRHCFALGFDGKTLIHPSQIAATNAIYNPGPQEVEWAEAVKAAVYESKGNVVTVRGKMVEALHVRQAERLLVLHASAVEECRLAEGDSKK